MTVEPDDSVWSVLEKNLANHHCAADVHKGVVGTVSRNVGKSGYATRTVEASGANASLVERNMSKSTPVYLQLDEQSLQWRTPRSAKQRVVATPLPALEKNLGLRFDTLLIDCEGCVENFLKENPGVLKQISTLDPKKEVRSWPL